MSIIDQALQKTQKSRNNIQTPQIENTPPRERLTLSIPNLPWLKIAISAGSCLILYSLFTHYSQILAFFHPAPKKPAITQVATPIAEKAKFELGGTFLSDHERIALINNRTLHVGDTVNGMQITAIDLNSVTLKNEDATLILRADTKT